MSRFLFALLTEESGRMQEVFRALRSTQSETRTEGNYTILLITCAIFAVLIVLGAIYQIIQTRQSYNSPKKLFWELCRAHHLSWTERWLLWKLAKWLALENPAVIFIDAGCFDPQKMPSVFAPNVKDFEKMKKRLFFDEDSTASAQRDEMKSFESRRQEDSAKALIAAGRTAFPEKQTSQDKSHGTIKSESISELLRFGKIVAEPPVARENETKKKIQEDGTKQDEKTATPVPPKVVVPVVNLNTWGGSAGMENHTTG